MIDRLLVVGSGSIGRRHLRLARGLLPGARIYVLRHQRGADIPEHADGCFHSIEDAVRFAPQVAVIANPAPLHLETALAIGRAGAHLLIEKPLAASFEQLESLADQLRLLTGVILIGYTLRFSRSLQKFRELILANHIGRVMSVRSEIGQYLPTWRPDQDYRKSVSARGELGGGILLELSHEFDYLHWIFGNVEAVEGTVSRQSDLEIDVNDSAHLVLTFSAPEKRLIASLNMDFIRRDSTRMCTAIGVDGSLRWNAISGTVEQFTANGSEWLEIFRHKGDSDEMYRLEWTHFLECISGTVQPSITLEDGRYALNLVRAAEVASVSGQRTPVPNYI